MGFNCSEKNTKSSFCAYLDRNANHTNLLNFQMSEFGHLYVDNISSQHPNLGSALALTLQHKVQSHEAESKRSDIFVQ